MINSAPAPSSLHLLHQVSLVLEKEGVRWGTIGAVALAYHGVIRASLDADAIITLKNSQTDLDSLAEKFRAAGMTVELRRGEEGDPLGFVIRITDELQNQVDLIGGLRRTRSRLKPWADLARLNTPYGFASDFPAIAFRVNLRPTTMSRIFQATSAR